MTARPGFFRFLAAHHFFSGLRILFFFSLFESAPGFILRVACLERGPFFFMREDLWKKRE